MLYLEYHLGALSIGIHRYLLSAARSDNVDHGHSVLVEMRRELKYSKPLQVRPNSWERFPSYPGDWGPR